MVKKIFLQDVKQRCSSNEEMLGYWSRDRLDSALNAIIMKINKQIQTTNKLKKSPNLFMDDKDLIESYLNDWLPMMIDRKRRLIELQKRLHDKDKDIDVDEELRNILKSVPIKD